MSADSPVDKVSWVASRSLAARLTRGEISSEQAVQRCISRYESREKEVRAFAAFDAERALGEARAPGPRARTARTAQRAARTAVRGQGRDRHGGPAHAAQFAALRGPPGRAGRRLRAPAAPGGLRAAGQGGHGRVRRYRPRSAHNEPARSRAHPGRLVGRLRRRRGHRHGAHGAGDADRRVGDPAVLVLRRGRLQAHLRAGPCAGTVAARAQPRYGGLDGRERGTAGPDRGSPQPGRMAGAGRWPEPADRAVPHALLARRGTRQPVGRGDRRREAVRRRPRRRTR